MFISHVNKISMLSESYLFILKYINGKVVKENSDFEKVYAFVTTLSANPFDSRSDAAMEGFQLLTGLPDIKGLSYYVSYNSIFKTSLDKFQPELLCRYGSLISAEIYIQDNWLYFMNYKNLGSDEKRRVVKPEKDIIPNINCTK